MNVGPFCHLYNASRTNLSNIRKDLGHLVKAMYGNGLLQYVLIFPISMVYKIGCIGPIVMN